MNKNPTPETSKTYQINATPDPDSPTGVYIPATFEEVISEFDKMLPVALKLKLLLQKPVAFFKVLVRLGQLSLFVSMQILLVVFKMNS